MPSFLAELNWLDALAMAAAAYLVLRGFARGCSEEFGRLAGAVSAGLAGYFGYAPLTRLAHGAGFFASNPRAAHLVVLIGLLAGCVALWLGVRRLLADALQLAIAQPFDALLGGLFGAVKAFVLVAFLCALGLLGPREDESARLQRDSHTVQTFAPLLKRLTTPGPS